MSALLTGIVPVFAMIALGWGLKKRAFLDDDGWRAVERLTYFAFYPAFLIPAVWRADFAGGAGAALLAGSTRPAPPPELPSWPPVRACPVGHRSNTWHRMHAGLA